jgi:hypothetical protein
MRRCSWAGTWSCAWSGRGCRQPDGGTCGHAWCCGNGDSERVGEAGVAGLALNGGVDHEYHTANGRSVDLATLARSGVDPTNSAKPGWPARSFPCVAASVIGGAAGALLEVHLQLAALKMPVILASLLSC